MTGNVFRIAVLLAVFATLMACASKPEPRETPRPLPAPERDVIAEVRAAGADAGDGLDVTPLRDPAVTDLRDAATRHEAARAYAEADAALVQALGLTSGDPELTQWRAELALAQGRYDDAVQLANASWENGPRLGGLCRRNWSAIRIARELSGYPAAATAAAAQIARCTVEPPVRM